MLEGKATGRIRGEESIMSSFWRILSLRLWETSEQTWPGGSWKYFLGQRLGQSGLLSLSTGDI